VEKGRDGTGRDGEIGERERGWNRHTKTSEMINEVQSKNENRHLYNLMIAIRTIISLKLPGIPVSASTTRRIPSRCGVLLNKSRTSRATRANVRGGRFSELPLPIPPVVLVVEEADDEERSRSELVVDDGNEEVVADDIIIIVEDEGIDDDVLDNNSEEDDRPPTPEDDDAITGTA
jgi:hypothetical protein